MLNAQGDIADEIGMVAMAIYRLSETVGRGAKAGQRNLEFWALRAYDVHLRLCPTSGDDSCLTCVWFRRLKSNLEK